MKNLDKKKDAAVMKLNPRGSKVSEVMSRLPNVSRCKHYVLVAERKAYKQ